MAQNQTPADLEKELKNVLSTSLEQHDQQDKEQEKELTEEMGKLEISGGNAAENGTTREENQKQGSPVAQEEDEQETYQTADFVDISRTNINFERNVLYPGSIDEVELTVGLKEEMLQSADNETAYLLRIIALCSNTEFNDLDEYVFSVRSNERYEYYEEVRFRIKKKEKAQVKVAVKVPIVKNSESINGTLSIQLENTIPVTMPIIAKCEIPQIVCMKQLFIVDEGSPIIKIPAKKNMRVPPIPFKNNSAYNLVLQAETATTQDMSDRAYDMIVQSTVNCMAKTPFFVNMQLKTNMNYRGMTPKSDTIRKILILKVKNSSVFFSYPFEALVYESSNSSSVS